MLPNSDQVVTQIFKNYLFPLCKVGLDVKLLTPLDKTSLEQNFLNIAKSAKTKIDILTYLSNLKNVAVFNQLARQFFTPNSILDQFIKVPVNKDGLDDYWGPQGDLHLNMDVLNLVTQIKQRYLVYHLVIKDTPVDNKLKNNENQQLILQYFQTASHNLDEPSFQSFFRTTHERARKFDSALTRFFSSDSEEFNKSSSKLPSIYTLFFISPFEKLQTLVESSLSKMPQPSSQTPKLPSMRIAKEKQD